MKYLTPGLAIMNIFQNGRTIYVKWYSTSAIWLVGKWKLLLSLFHQVWIKRNPPPFFLYFLKKIRDKIDTDFESGVRKMGGSREKGKVFDSSASNWTVNIHNNGSLDFVKVDEAPFYSKKTRRCDHKEKSTALSFLFCSSFFSESSMMKSRDQHSSIKTR